MHKTPPDVVLSFPRISFTTKSPETNLICIVVLYFPHDNIVWINMCDECMRSNVMSVCHKVWSTKWKHEQICSQTIKISGLPMRAKHNHFKTICEQTFDSSPTDPISSSLNWWSSMHGVATLYKSCFIRQFAIYCHAFLSMIFHINEKMFAPNFSE